MFSRWRSRRSRSSSSHSDESISLLSKKSSTMKHRNSIDIPSPEEGEIGPEMPTPSPDQKKHSQESPSKTHDSWSQLSSIKHVSTETESKFSNKQNYKDEVKYERGSSPKASKWDDDTCTKDAPKRSSHKRSSSIWDDENETKDAQKWEDDPCIKDAPKRSSHKRSSSVRDDENETKDTQKSSKPSDDIKTDLSRNGNMWVFENNNKDGKKLSNPKQESSSSREAKTNRNYTKDSHRSSGPRQRSSDVGKRDHGDNKKPSSSRWSPFDSKKIDSDSSLNSTKRGYRNSTGSSSLTDSKWSIRTSIGPVDEPKASGSQSNAWDSKKSNSDANMSSSQKWSSWDSKENNVKSALDDKKNVAETNAKDVLTSSVPKWDSGNSKEAKTDSNLDSLKESNRDSIWDKLAAKTNSKDEDADKWGSWDTNESKTNKSWNDANKSSRSNRESWTSSPRHGGSKASTDRWNSRGSNDRWNSRGSNDRWNSRGSNTRYVAETNAKDAMTPSVPKWDSGNSNGTKTDSKWDSCNLKESNTDSVWDRLAAKTETNSKDADEWGSWNTNENKTNSSWTDANKSSESNREMNKKNSSISFSPRQGGSKTSTDGWNSRRSNTTSRDDSKWERGRHYDRHSSGRRSSYNDRRYDDIEPRRRTWSDSNNKDLRLPTTANKENSGREKIDEKSHSKFLQNVSELGSWNDTKDSKHSVSSLNFSKLGDPSENEGASSNTLPWNCSEWDTQEDSNNKKVTVHCSPNKVTKTSESTNVCAINNEVSAPIPSGMYVPNDYTIAFTEVIKVKENDNKLPPIHLHTTEKNITHYWPQPIDPVPAQFENQAAVKASNVLVQPFSTAGVSKNNGSARVSGTNIVQINEDNGPLIFKSKITDFAKDILRPHWEGGHVSEEEHNIIVRKVLNKVVGTMTHGVIAESERYADSYIACNRIKLTNLVAAYLDNLERAKRAKMP